MMMTVCWMDRMTALESPDVAGGRYINRGGGDFFTAAAELPVVSGTLIRFMNSLGEGGNHIYCARARAGT